MNPLIKADNLVVEFPVYNTSHRSIKTTLLNAATGGRIAADARGHVYIRALDGVSFEFREGDRIGLQGHNGSGKSTLLRVLAGCYEPTSGALITQGRIASLLDISSGFDSESTGFENIFLRGILMGLTQKQIRAKLEEIADFSELGEYLDMPLRTYSAGMTMRLAFSISTNVDADILLMDEWLSAGDAEFVKKAEDRMNDLVEKTPLLVLASHSEDLLKEVCNRRYLLNHGKMEEVLISIPDQSADEQIETSIKIHKRPIGSERVELLNVEAIGLIDNLETTIHDEFAIRMTYNIRKVTDARCVPNFHFTLPDGTYVFVSSANQVEKLLPGIYHADCKIPGDFLNAGTYIVAGVITSYFDSGSYSIDFFERNSLIINIIDPMDERSNRRGFKKPIPGVVRPKLEWKISRESE